MNYPIINTITDYIQSQARNKVIFHSQDLSDLITVNVGLRISENIYNFKEPGRISMRVSSELDRVLNAAISNHDLFGKYLSIENLGILFEPELKIDFNRLLDSYSQNNALFVRWNGEIDSENIYFLTKENGIKINIKNVSHIAI
ncbi:MAG: hypothetical protein M0Q12_00745 [Synergistaceae bacterium]|nr:hypothetical protein [Synergistaceae bacterium]